jgi:hypothetical protein
VTTPPGERSPYINPQILTQAPTGISWNTIPFGTQVTAEQRAAEAYNICERATALADGYCNQTLRATLDTEFMQGPDFYVTQQPATGNMRLILSRWPVLGINAVQVSPNLFPRSFTSLPLNFWQPEYPSIDVFGSSAPSGSAQGGQAIIISGQAGGGWVLGRNGYLFQVQYVSGWPHCGLTAASNVGDSSLQVDDCSGWGITSLTGTTSARGILYDNQQEAVVVTAATVTAGPGTLTLSAPLTYSHEQSVLLSALPQSIQWACVLMATSIALTRGATATTVHTVSPGSSAPGMKSPDQLMTEAELALHSYKRVI